jgi:hypothetical protein
MFSIGDWRTSRSSIDSDLEGFSHNRTGVSFSSLVYQLNEKTNYLIRLFLSY